MRIWIVLLLVCLCQSFGWGQHLQRIPQDRFIAAYFDNSQTQGQPTLVRTDDRILFDWRDGAPDPQLPSDQFSAHWRGRFSFEAGNYIFNLQTADYAQLLIDGQLILDTQQSDQRSVALELTAGDHVVELIYAHATGDARIQLDWQQDRLSTPCSPQANQFCLQFFGDHQTQATPLLEQTATSIRGSWGLQAPSSDLPADGFAAVWRGEIGLTGATYRFSGSFNGALQITLGDTLLFDAADTGQPQSFTLEAPTTEGLSQLQVRYLHGNGNADIAIDWLAINLDHQQAALGINIHQLTYWSPEWTLLDAFKSAGGWFTQTDDLFDTAEQHLLDTDAQGWVRSLPDQDSGATYRYVAALLLNGNGGKHPAGRYVITYEGEGQIHYFFDAQKIERLSRPGRDVIEIAQPTNGGILLRITQTDPRNVGNYIRNIRVIMPGFRCANDPFNWVKDPQDCPGGASSAQAFETVNASQPFHPALLQNIRQYKAIRHMDFLATNSSTVSTWESRTQRDTSRYLFDKGAPPELAVDMAAFLGSDLWLNIPHQATDAYVTNLATYARQQLQTHQRVVIEYSNEVWNLIFPQGNWVQEQGQSQWPNDPTDPYFKRINWYGKRANEVIGLWKQAWGDQAHRVTGVMGGQLSNETIAQVALDCPLWAAQNGGQDCTGNIDALTIAPYFGGYFGSAEYYDQVSNWIAQGQAVALDNLFADLTQGGLLPDGQSGLEQAIGWMDQAKATADAYDLGFVAYEGGQHMVGVGALINDDALTALFNAANRDPRMFSIYETYLQAWREAGGQLFCLWISMSSFDRFGNWGIQESMDDTDNPKYRAVQAFLRDNNCWWPDCDTGQP